MNPARTLAPAIAGGPTDALWVYLTAPLVGAAVAVAVYRYLAPAAQQTGRRLPASAGIVSNRGATYGSFKKCLPFCRTARRPCEP